MAFKSNGANRPTIEHISPGAAIPGGDVQIRGQHFIAAPRPVVSVGSIAAPLVVGSDRYVVARIPEGADDCRLVVSNGEKESAPTPFAVGALVAGDLHPVACPAIGRDGSLYTTFSGSRGQKTPVAVYRIDANGSVSPHLTDLMNATALAFDSEGALYISSRFDGIVYRSTASGVMSVYCESMGVATGIAFDHKGDLYVGDRSGTIFKISDRGQGIFVFATIEPSIAAYHLAFGPRGYLYVTGPTTSSYDSVQRISPAGEVEVFYRGLGRPQGIAFDAEGNLYVAASIAGRKGIVKITPKREASLYLSGPNIVGLAFAPGGDMIVTTTGAIYRVPAGIAGRPLP